MKQLDNPKTFVQLDRHGVLASADLLGEQFATAWHVAKQVSLSASYRNVDSIVVVGMGGSALGPHIIQSLFSDALSVPMTIVNDYRVPASVGSKTLFIVSSYSGTTEEPLTSIAVARRRGAKLLAVSGGGVLATMIKQKKIPGVVVPTNANPSGQPRMGLGYALGAQFGLLSTLKLLTISDAGIALQTRAIAQWQKQFGSRAPASKNPAKKLAQALHGRVPLLVGAEFLAGNLHTFSNQLNENSKVFASYFLIPELNHHLLEGLRFPKNLGKLLTFVLIDSGKYLAKNRTRLAVTETVIKKQGIPVVMHRLTAEDALSQSFELLSLGTYTSIYLAMLNNIDPAPIPWVDFFKAALKKRTR